MKAAYINRLGPPEVIAFGELPPPVLHDDEVIVEVEYAAVNHVDTFIRSGSYVTPMTFPFVVGRDMVGTVVATGDHAPERFSVGQRVWSNSLGYDGRQGSTSELVAVPCERLYAVPAGVNHRSLVALAHPGSAAVLALFRHAELRPGEIVVIAGAGGNVGRAAVRFAARAGASVIAVARRADWATCHRLGAAQTVDFSDQTYAADLAAACQGGIDVYLDTSGHLDLHTVIGLLARRGRVVVMAGLDATAALPLGALYVRDARVQGFAISNAPASDLADAAAAMSGLSADDPLYSSQAVTELSFSQAGRAHRLLEQDQTEGARLVLRPDLD